jgi:recombinational DNA repair protein RecT
MTYLEFTQLLDKNAEAIKAKCTEGVCDYELFIKETKYWMKQNLEILECTESSLLGSILYLSEFGLPPFTPEGYSYILVEKVGKKSNALPFIGYRGIIELAYLNPKVKEIGMDSVFEHDVFESYVDFTDGRKGVVFKHQKTFSQMKENGVEYKDAGKLMKVYSFAVIEGINHVFTIVDIADLKKIEKNSRLAKKEKFKSNSIDFFNIMQSKVCIKLMLKTLPKQDSRLLCKALDFDNRIEYNKNVLVEAVGNDYEFIDTVKRQSGALAEVLLDKIELKIK